MPLVSRAGLRNVFVQANEPGIWSQGCVWSDTDNADFFKNVCGIATQIGGSVVTCSTVMAFCETIGNYTSPCSASASSESDTGTGCTTTEYCFSTIDTATVIGDANTRVAMSINNGSADIGKLIKKVRFDVKKFGTPTGNFSYKVWDACCVIKGTVSSAICALTTCSVATELTLDKTVILEANDKIGLEYLCGNACNHLRADLNNNACQGNPPPTGFGFDRFDGCVWTEADTQSLLGKFDSTPGAVTCVPLVAGNAVDCCNATAWKSDSECNPNITVDLGATTLLSAVMLRRGACDTSTTVQIRASTTCPPGACDLIRTVKSACLTADTNKFVRFNVKEARFVMIRGGDASVKVGEYNNIKTEKNTVCEVAASSGRLCISATDCTLCLDGT